MYTRWNHILCKNIFKGAVHGQTDDGVEFSIPLAVYVRVPSSMSTDGLYYISTYEPYTALNGKYDFFTFPFFTVVSRMMTRKSQTKMYFLNFINNTFYFRDVNI